jgi:hypothetical protein
VTPSTADSAPQRDLGERPGNKASENRTSGPTPHVAAPDEFDIERLFAGESPHEEDPESLTPEEEKFIEHVVAWLAPRQNADQLLDRIEETLWLNAVAVSREDAVEKERADESASQPTTGEERPTQGGI